MKYTLTAAVLLSLISSSCRKHSGNIARPEPDETTYKQVQACSTDQLYDSIKLAAALHGKWKEAWMDYAGARHVADSDLRVTFLPEGIYTMRVNSRVMSAGNWNLAIAGGGYFGLKMKDTVNAYGGIPGRILLCNDQLFFDDNYPVGARQYYTRVP